MAKQPPQDMKRIPSPQFRHCEARNAVAIQCVFYLGERTRFHGKSDTSPTRWIATPCGLAMTGCYSATVPLIQPLAASHPYSA